MATSRPIVLFITPVLGHPPKGGPELRIENSLKALSGISSLYLYSCVPLGDMRIGDVRDYYRKIVQKVFFAPSCRKRNIVYRAARHALRLSFRFAFKRMLKDEIDYHSILKTANKIKADAIWLGYGNISYPLLAFLKSRTAIPVVLDTDSVWSRFVLRGMPYAKDDDTRDCIEAEGRAKENEESRGTKLADVTTAVSEVDAKYYRALANTPEQIHIFSNVIDPAGYQHAPPPAGFKSPSIFLAGTFGKESPMEDAALWMIEHVFPIVKREIPVIHFYIAGIQSREVLADIHDPSISIVGEVESVLPYLSNAAVSVVPLRFESGTRFKILEAGACSIPVVSTTLGAEGIPVVDGKDILIADSPEAFAECVIRVVRDPHLSACLGKNLHDLVSRHFSVDALCREGKKVLENLGLK